MNGGMASVCGDEANEDDCEEGQQKGQEKVGEMV